MSRFGSKNFQEIDNIIKLNVPTNTVKSKTSIWRQFTNFCEERQYELNDSTPVAQLNNILKDWATNMKKEDGREYKEYTVKCMWNSTAKSLQELFYTKYNIQIDPFEGIEFKSARDARNSKRRILKKYPEKRKVIDSKSNDKEFKTEMEIIQSPELVSEEIEIIQSPELVSEESRPYSPEYYPARRKKAKLYHDKNNDLSEDEKSQLFHNRLHFNTNFHTEDEFDVVGRNVANKLRSLSKETAILAEKLMMDVLFAAQMGTLNSETTLVLEGHAAY